LHSLWDNFSFSDIFDQYAAVRAPVGTYFEVNGKQMFMGSDFVKFLFSFSCSLFANKSALLCLTSGQRAASLVAVY
jgi:hypothetical protein